MIRRMIWATFLIVPPLLAEVGCSSSQIANDSSDDQLLKEVIARLEARNAGERDPEFHARESAIDALRRLREHNSWPVINSPVESGKVEGDWISDTENDGFRPTLGFWAQGYGEWHTDKEAHPGGLLWLLEGKHIRILQVSDYKESFNWEIIEKTYEYEVKGNTLTLRRRGEVLRWTRYKR